MKTFFWLFSVVALSFSLSGCKKSETTESEEKTQGAVETVSPEVAATVSGKIKFSGAPPKVKMIALTGDAFCAAHHAKAQIASEEVVVNPNKTLKYVLVFVKKGLEGKTYASPKDPAILDQQGCWYHPHVLAVMVNQPLLIRNSDETLHNIHFMPKANQGFNFAQPAKGMERTLTLSKEEVVIPIKCDVHSWMGGYVGVLPHPYFAVTGEDGSFSLKNLPPGDYEIEAWHEKYGVKTLTVKLGPKESKTINFTFQAGSM